MQVHMSYYRFLGYCRHSKDGHGVSDGAICVFVCVYVHIYIHI